MRVIKWVGLSLSVGLLVHCGGDDGGTKVVTGDPSASVSPANIDFGAADCAGSAPSEQTVIVRNSGTGVLTFSSAISAGTQFTINGASTGSVQPGEQATIGVVSKPVPAATAAGAAIQQTLTIMTNDALHSAIEVPLKVTAQGATLTMTPTKAEFGAVTVGVAAAPLQLGLKNTGNKPVSVTLGASSDAQFSVSYTGAPAQKTLNPDESLAGLVANFTPSSLNLTNATVALNVTGAVCGASTAAISLSGQGASGVTTNATTLNFGSVNCGGVAAAAQKVKLTNTTGASFTWSGVLTLGTDSPYTISPATGTLANNASVDVTVTPKGIPASPIIGVQPDGFADSLTLSTSVPNDNPHIVQLHESAQGAILAFAPASVDFGNVELTKNAAASFDIVNSGNLAAQVTVQSDDAAFTPPAATLSIPSAGKLGSQASFAPGNTASQQNGTLSLTAVNSTVLCAPLPEGLKMIGTGVDTTVSSVLFSPGSLNFGYVNCGTTGPARTITFTNPTAQAYTIVDLSLENGDNSPFMATMSPANGVVAANATLTVTVTPKAIPATSEVPGVYDDVLDIQTDAANDIVHQIPLSMGAQGSVLSFVAPAAFVDTVVGSTSQAPFFITNDGNAAATVLFQNISNTVFSFDASTTLNGGSSLFPTATFTPPTSQATAMQTYTGTAQLAVDSSTVLCQPLPNANQGNPFTLSGNGTTEAPVIKVIPSAINFGFVSCATAEPARTIKVTNSSNTARALSATFLSGGANYTLALSGATVPKATANAQGSATITVTPKQIPTNVNTTLRANGYGGVLQITAGTSVFVVPIYMTAQGVALDFGTDAITVNRTNQTQKVFKVTNCTSECYGASPASVNLTLSNITGGAQFKLDGAVGAATAQIPGGASSSFVLSDTGTLAGTARINLGVTAGTKLCRPLPGYISVTGQ